MSRKHEVRDPEKINFINFAFLQRVNVFTGQGFRNLVVQSRQAWMLDIFKTATDSGSKHQNYRL
jgi:hypothetical protein